MPRFRGCGAALVALLACHLPPAGAADLRLDAITQLGGKKSAYVTTGGSQLVVGEGGQVGGMVVRSIEGRTLVLVSGDGTEYRLELHAHLSLPSDAAARAAEPRAEEEGGAERPKVIAPPPPEKVSEGVYRIDPHFIPDDQIPPGYRRQRTPFGDMLIEEKR
ncbi:hypothetical protein [Endothiovibrio diazotrophicus]